MRLIFPATIELDALPSPTDDPIQNLQSWTQVLRTGKFKFSEKGPELDVTEAMIDQMVENAARYNEAPFDFDHLGTSGKGKAGDGKAAGWASKWERRGNKLYALVNWTAEAAELIRNKAYKYVSATFIPKFFDPESAKDVGARLLGAAITNYPFVQGMDPLALAAAADISLTDREMRVSQAFDAKFNPLGSDFSMWISDYFDDYVIVKKDGKRFKLPFEFDEQLKVNFTSEPVEVITTHQELNMPPAETVTIEQFSALQKQLTELSTGRIQDQEKAAKLEVELAASRNEVVEMKATTEVDGLIKAGKLLPKQKDWAVGYYKADPVQFAAFAATLEPLIKLDTEHGDGGTGTRRKKDETVEEPSLDFENKDKAVMEFSALIDTHRKENPSVTYGEAMKIVSMKNPGVYRRYRESFATYTGDDSTTVQ